MLQGSVYQVKMNTFGQKIGGYYYPAGTIIEHRSIITNTYKGGRINQDERPASNA